MIEQKIYHRKLKVLTKTINEEKHLEHLLRKAKQKSKDAHFEMSIAHINYINAIRRNTIGR